MRTQFPLFRRAARGSVVTSACAIAVLAAGCGGTDPAFKGSLNDAQIQGLDRAWTQRITAVTAPAARAGAQATKLYEACAQLDQSSTFLQAVHSSCAPTAVTVKLGALIPARCATPSSQCVRALDRAKAANDTLLATLQDVDDAVKVATSDPACRAEFTTDDARVKTYQDLSAAYDVVAVGADRRDKDIMALGQRKITEATAAIGSRLTPAEQIDRFRQACGIDQGD
ncbi:MAG: hypothetical protein J7513_05740 [Solirubrobacteraceae bacterium]|nr:hypothetical protein [Solirubrobacteraceae bacterium]